MTAATFTSIPSCTSFLLLGTVPHDFPEKNWDKQQRQVRVLSLLGLSSFTENRNMFRKPKRFMAG